MSRIMDIAQQQLAPSINVPMDYLYSEDAEVYLNSKGNKLYYEKPAYHAERHEFSIKDHLDHLLTFCGGPIVQDGILGEGLGYGAGLSVYGEGYGGGGYHIAYGSVGLADPTGAWELIRYYKPSPGGTPTINSKIMLRAWPDGLYVGPHVHATWALQDASDIASVNSQVTLGHPDYPWHDINVKKSITHAYEEILIEDGDISQTVLYANPNHLTSGFQVVRVGYYLYMVDVGTAGTLQLTFQWNDGVANKYFTPAVELDLTDDTTYSEGTFIAVLGPGSAPSYLGRNLYYDIALANMTGDPTYSGFITAEVLHTYIP